MSFLAKNYNRKKIAFSKGKGSYLISVNGQKYLDFVQGIAVNSLGHAHPRLIKTLNDQSKKVWHVSNAFIIPEGEKLAKKIVKKTFADFVMFQNSGAEATEAAIKVARRYFYSIGKPNKNRILCIKNSFHGRTIAAIYASGSKKMTEGFGPKVSGFDHLNFGDHKSLKKLITKNTAAVMVETIMGEGGIKVIPDWCLKGLRKLCDKKNVLLILDEVQCGIGRSGDFFAFEKSKVKPDIVPIAKGIGGGFPIGAVLMNKKVASGMTAGTHGSTFGGNPLAMTVGNTVMDIISNKKFLKNVKNISKYFLSNLKEIQKEYPHIIKEIRGRGLLIGIQLKKDQAKFIKKLMDNNLLTIRAAENVVRVLPPLNVKKNEINLALKIINFINLKDIPAKDLRKIIIDAKKRKNLRKNLSTLEVDKGSPLKGKMLIQMFEKASSRTRISFYLAIKQLGGGTLTLKSNELHLGQGGESISDTAKILSTYGDGFMLRTDSDKKIEDFKKYLSIPIINGLSRSSHPTQVLSDVFTVEEIKKKPISKLNICWIGDSNNVLDSLIAASVKFSFKLSIGCPKNFEPGKEVRSWVKNNNKKIFIYNDPKKAVIGADVMFSDKVISLNDKGNKKKKIEQFKKFKIDKTLMSYANKDCIFLHCLPRGSEVSDEVFLGKKSHVWQQALNRVHVQKSILLYCFGNLR